MKKILIYLSFLIVLGACNKDDDKDDVKTTGDLILSSQIKGSETNYYVEGFLFDEGKMINYSLTSSPIPDLVLENSLDLSGNVVGANLTSPQSDAAFYLAGEFATLNEAETLFNGIADAGLHVYTKTAPDVKANQVYIFQTRGNKYAKLLIKDFAIVENPTRNYVQITIQWVYQPSGDKSFEIIN